MISAFVVFFTSTPLRCCYRLMHADLPFGSAAAAAVSFTNINRIVFFSLVLVAPTFSTTRHRLHIHDDEVCEYNIYAICFKFGYSTLDVVVCECVSACVRCTSSLFRTYHILLYICDTVVYIL